MRILFAICFWASLIKPTFAQEVTFNILENESKEAMIREHTSCANAWYALRVISRIGYFDERRFGSENLLDKLTEGSCDEFSVGATYRDTHGELSARRHFFAASAASISESAKALLNSNLYTPTQDYTQYSLREDRAICAPLQVRHPDDLGVLLYYLILKEPERKSPLYLIYAENLIYCDFDFWLSGVRSLDDRWLD